MLGYERTELEELKAIFTVVEISQQPGTWAKTYDQIMGQKQIILAFINQVISADDYDIIFTGAGTSEYIGNTLFSELSVKYCHRVKSYGTTDIVAMPTRYIAADKPTLLISFGRSGSSPESMGAVNAANAVNDKVYHLFITCNPNGEMAKWSVDNERCYGLLLTPETCDRGFAMTSSFTNMLLAAYLCLSLDTDKKEIFVLLRRAVTELLEKGYSDLKDMITGYAFKRIVYLGSNSLKGIAQEAALKMLELTAGEVVVLHDSPLGFRHGPKSIIDDDTLLVAFVSDDPFTGKYDLDLVEEMSLQRQGNKILAVCGQANDRLAQLADYCYCFGFDKELPNTVLGAAFIVVGQIIAVLKSIALGITPDNPCPSGAVNRVVKGVTIYPYTK